jgi:hypothetical protein
MQALPHTGHVTLIYIIYTKAGTHLPTQIFTNCVPNTKHNKIQHSSNTLSVIWYSSPNCKLQAPHHSTHILHTTSWTDRQKDRQTQSPHDAVYCTSQTMLINHEYGLTSNGIRHSTYWMSSKSSSSYGPDTCRTDGRTDGQPNWHNRPTVFDSCTFCEQRITVCDFRFPPQSKCDLHSSGM